MKKVMFLLPLLAHVLCLAGPAQAQAGAQMLRTYPCYRLAKEPVLDGKISEDTTWTTVPATSGFVKLGDARGRLAEKQTFVKMGYTKEAVYVGMKCLEPDMDKIRGDLKDGDKVWREDSVEVFILPKGADDYFQFVVNSVGSRANLRGPFAPKMPLRNWEVCGHKGKDYYSVEIKIPFDVLGKVPSGKEEWRGNFCRNTYTSGDKYTLLSYHKAFDRREWGFQEPRIFGTIIFEDRILSASEARKIEAKLSAPPQERE